MQAFHNDIEIKNKYVSRLQAHMAADELIRGTGFENGRGCFVGCTLNKYDHEAFEDELGIPEWLARLMDFLHENTSEKIWPTLGENFLLEIKPGVDLESLKPKVHIFILNLNRARVLSLDYLSDELKNQVIDAIDQCISLHQAEAWDESAAWSAESAYLIEEIKQLSE